MQNIRKGPHTFSRPNLSDGFWRRLVKAGVFPALYDPVINMHNYDTSRDENWRTSTDLRSNGKDRTFALIYHYEEKERGRTVKFTFVEVMRPGSRIWPTMYQTEEVLALDLFIAEAWRLANEEGVFE